MGPYTRNSIKIGPTPLGAVGMFHTHPDVLIDNPNHPSSPDRAISKKRGIPGAVFGYFGVSVYAHESILR